MEAPTDSIPVEHLQRLLEEVAEKKGIKNPRYSVSAGSKKGDNYLGMLYRVEVREGAAAEPALHLIIKGMPLSQRRREETQCVRFFDHEYSMYYHVLPALTRFVSAAVGVEEMRSVHGGDSFPYVPPLHHARHGGVEGEDALVLEDMRPLGFTMADRRAGLGEQHVRVTLRALAYLHASSMAMQDQRPEEFDKLRGHLGETLFSVSNAFAKDLDQMAQKAFGYVKARFPEGSVGHTKLKSLVDSYVVEMGKLCGPSPDGGNVICHGDVWTNNVLFKCNKLGAVEEACLLDFQLARYSMPVLDIAYLVYCCTTREFRDKYLDKLLREYHDQLSANLRRFGSDADKLYSKETMQTQMRERMRFGLGMALMTVPLFLAETDEIPDMDDAYDKGSEIHDIMNIESKSAAERDKRISDVLQEMIDRGWL